MSLVDFGKRLLEAAKRGDTDEVRDIDVKWCSIHNRLGLFRFLTLAEKGIDFRGPGTWY